MSADIAEFLDSVAASWPPGAIVKSLFERWPNLPKEAYLRALEVAIEVRRGTLAESQARLCQSRGDRE